MPFFFGSFYFQLSKALCYYWCCSYRKTEHTFCQKKTAHCFVICDLFLFFRYIHFRYLIFKWTKTKQNKTKSKKSLWPPQLAHNWIQLFIQQTFVLVIRYFRPIDPNNVVINCRHRLFEASSNFNSQQLSCCYANIYRNTEIRINHSKISNFIARSLFPSQCKVLFANWCFMFCL